jgi:hypothetical protein
MFSGDDIIDRGKSVTLKSTYQARCLPLRGTLLGQMHLVYVKGTSFTPTSIDYALGWFSEIR